MSPADGVGEARRGGCVGCAGRGVWQPGCVAGATEKAMNEIRRNHDKPVR